MERTLEIECPPCGKKTVIKVDAEAYALWSARKILVQDAFPELSVDERETLVSGICRECWDRMFGQAG